MLADVGVDHAENTASFLGHLPGQRGARGIRANLPEGTLLLVDEASMMSTEDMADITAFAARTGTRSCWPGTRSSSRPSRAAAG